MKKNIYSIALFLLCGFHYITPRCVNDLVIENESNWAITISYKKNNKVQEIPFRQGEGFKKIDCLEGIQEMSFYRSGDSAWGTGAVSNPLTNYIKGLQYEANQHPGQNAHIVIKATTFGWDVKPKWQSAGNVLTVEHFNELTLDAVLQGHLDQDAQTKAHEILAGDYSQAAKMGIVNLATNLVREFSDKTFTTVKRDQPLKIWDAKTQKYKVLNTYNEEHVSPIALPPQDAKQIIDRLYRSFTNYKAKGYMQ